jgi:hypothetical protein
MQAEPEPNDPTHCLQQVYAQGISQEVGQVTAAARQSVYGQAAADAVKTCPEQLKPLQQKHLSFVCYERPIKHRVNIRLLLCT